MITNVIHLFRLFSSGLFLKIYLIAVSRAAINKTVIRLTSFTISATEMPVVDGILDIIIFKVAAAKKRLPTITLILSFSAAKKDKKPYRAAIYNVTNAFM